MEDSHKELESQQEASTPQNGADARSQAGDIKPSPIEAPDQKYSEKYTNNPADEKKKKAKKPKKAKKTKTNTTFLKTVS